MNQRADRTLLAVDGNFGLALTLHWVGDRFAQRIFVVEGEKQRLLAESCEAIGDAAEASNADAPAFQELSVETIVATEAALLVGMSRRDYWSAAVENLAANRALRFDLCRKGEAADRIVCGYRLADGATAALTGNLAVIPIDAARRCVVACEPIAGIDAELKLEAGRLLIEGRRVESTPPLRCKFVWRIESISDPQTAGNAV